MNRNGRLNRYGRENDTEHVRTVQPQGLGAEIVVRAAAVSLRQHAGQQLHAPLDLAIRRTQKKDSLESCCGIERWNVFDLKGNVSQVISNAEILPFRERAQSAKGLLGILQGRLTQILVKLRGGICRINRHISHSILTPSRLEQKCQLFHLCTSMSLKFF